MGRTVSQPSGAVKPPRPIAYIRDRFLPAFTEEFGRPPADPASAFVPLRGVALEQILCHQEERVVARDNTLTLDGLVLQLDKQPGRRSCAGLRVLVRRHHDGRHSLWLGARGLGLYDARDRLLPPHAA